MLLRCLLHSLVAFAFWGWILIDENQTNWFRKEKRDTTVDVVRFQAMKSKINASMSTWIGSNIRVMVRPAVAGLSDITLIRTDTTLDLSYSPRSDMYQLLHHLYLCSTPFCGAFYGWIVVHRRRSLEAKCFLTCALFLSTEPIIFCCQGMLLLKPSYECPIVWIPTIWNLIVFQNIMPPKSAKTDKKVEKKAPPRPTRCPKDFKWQPHSKVL